jgi:hypothetical protein
MRAKEVVSLNLLQLLFHNNLQENTPISGIYGLRGTANFVQKHAAATDLCLYIKRVPMFEEKEYVTTAALLKLQERYCTDTVFELFKMFFWEAENCTE